ncbi:uncharacterized protein LOC121689839 [Alosa sapidissima]|uniref:uncharacterized protein LOC121689839 n=1 Tax=Alosa sapidissima TaxID=34773 RepID=UPI001C09A178|nr:uncharacterized protein LOC121689839 [Alosa sapidissima]
MVNSLAFCRMGVLLAVFSMSMSTSVVVREGQSVQMNCSHSVSVDGFNSFIWLKQPSRSPPVCILTINYYQGPDRLKTESMKPSARYHNGYSDANASWTLNALASMSALEIRNVSVSDSGLYYCGKSEDGCMDFHNVTYLTVTDESDAELLDTAEEGRSWECGTVVLVLGVLSAVLSLVLVILILTKCRGGQNSASGHHTSSPPDQMQDSDSLNYAALSVSANKKRRSNLQTDHSHVLYAATR